MKTIFFTILVLMVALISQGCSETESRWFAPDTDGDFSETEIESELETDADATEVTEVTEIDMTETDVTETDVTEVTEVQEELEADSIDIVVEIDMAEEMVEEEATEIETDKVTCTVDTDCPNYIDSANANETQCLAAEYCEKNLVPNPKTGSFDTTGICVKANCWATKPGAESPSCVAHTMFKCINGCYPKVSQTDLNSVAPEKEPCQGSYPQVGCCLTDPVLSCTPSPNGCYVDR